MDYKEKVIALLNSQDLPKEQKEKLESIFPELKESEDEKVRKEMLMFFKNYSENGTWKAIPNVDEWIAWLEKQGETSVCKVKIGETYKCIASPRYTCFRMGDIYHVKDNFVAELINTCSGCFVLLENHGKQIPANSAKTCKDEQKPVNSQFTPEQASVLDKHIDEFIEDFKKYMRGE